MSDNGNVPKGNENYFEILNDDTSDGSNSPNRKKSKKRKSDESKSLEVTQLQYNSLVAAIEKLKYENQQILSAFEQTKKAYEAIKIENQMLKAQSRDEIPECLIEDADLDNDDDGNSNVSSDTENSDDETNMESDVHFPKLDFKPTQKSKVTITAKSVPKKNKPPIFVVYNINQKDLSVSLQKIFKHKNFSFNLINRNCLNLSTFTLEDYNNAKQFLLNSKFKFYTYTPRETKPFSLVLTKLCPTFDKEEILEYLKNLKLNIEILNLKSLGNGKWIIQLSKNSNIVEFKRIRYILNCKIGIENVKNNRPIQCKNCQRFNHVASNCNMPYRCVKCGESHGPNNCKIPNKENNNKDVTTTDPVTGLVIKRVGFPVKCINCNVEGHTASSKQCPKRVEILMNIKNKKKVVEHKKISITNSLVKTGMSYSASVRNANPDVSHNIENNSNFNFMDSECKRLLGGSIFKCVSKISEFSNSYSKLRNDEEKTNSLFNLLISMRLNG